MDRPDISYINPGKNDHSTLKIRGERIYVQKRYLLWPLRDVLGMLNRTDSDSDGETIPSKFDKLLTLSVFYKFIKTRKQYIYNNKIPQNTCLCEICENTLLLSEELNSAGKSKDVPFDPRSYYREIFL